jgi:periplasmic divalent cation tolerance protein
MHIVIFITCANKKEAQQIALALVEKKLAACVNIAGDVTSFFWWEGKVDRSQEVLLIVKTLKTRLAKIIKAVKSLHSYQVPEIIALPISGGDRPYLDWINDSIGKS